MKKRDSLTKSTFIFFISFICMNFFRCGEENINFQFSFELKLQEENIGYTVNNIEVQVSPPSGVTMEALFTNISKITIELLNETLNKSVRFVVDEESEGFVAGEVPIAVSLEDEELVTGDFYDLDSDGKIDGYNSIYSYKIMVIEGYKIDDTKCFANSSTTSSFQFVSQNDQGKRTQENFVYKIDLAYVSENENACKE